MKSDHFATFPPDLIEPCIKAGTSEKGACSVCGAGWVRVVEKETANRFDKNTPRLEGLDTGIWSGRCGDSSSTTTGWQPSCDCNAQTRPAIVLDPFVGSGTTVMVSNALGRQAVGLDLSWQYLKENARERIGMTAMDEWMNGKTEESNLDGLPLFT